MIQYNISFTDYNISKTLLLKTFIGAAHSHRTTFWPTSQLIDKLETILTDIICIIFYMTYFIEQVYCNRYTLCKK